METEQRQHIILAIPGMWATEAAIRLALLQHPEHGLLIAGDQLWYTKTGTKYQIEINGHDSETQKAFISAGTGRISEGNLKQIARYEHMIYIFGFGGNLQAAQEMIEVSTLFLKVGGLAVKVETAGVAHSAEAWQQFAIQGSTSLSLAYTAYISGKDGYYSCGMHNLGMRDAIVSQRLPMQEALHLLAVFLGYIVVEQPQLANGHTFSVNAHAPRYQVHYEQDTRYPPEHPFHNPFGLWQLTQLKK